uniref:Uncharacterized protein n=1 Tax=Arundo donax TaxID=35708 RepID=A0A0A8Y5W7_ARUDO
MSSMASRSWGRPYWMTS